MPREKLSGRIVSSDGRCLDAGNLNAGSEVALSTCNANPSIQWAYDASSSQIRSHHNSCLEISQGNGSGIRLWSCQQSSWTQEWAPDVAGGKMMNRQEGLCLRITGAESVQAQSCVTG